MSPNLVPNEDRELFALYLATAEKVSDRRAQANGWMLSVNTAIVGLYGYLQAAQQVGTEAVTAVWFWAIPIAGVFVCLAWVALLESYRSLNSAKFKVLQELEQKLGYPLFRNEREFYKKERRRNLTQIEMMVPWAFAALFLAMALAGLF